MYVIATIETSMVRLRQRRSGTLLQKTHIKKNATFLCESIFAMHFHTTYFNMFLFFKGILILQLELPRRKLQRLRL